MGRAASWADGGGERKGGGGTSWAAEQHAEARKRRKEKGKGGDAGPAGRPHGAGQHGRRGERGERLLGHQQAKPGRGRKKRAGPNLGLG